MLEKYCLYEEQKVVQENVADTAQHNNEHYLPSHNCAKNEH